MSRAPSTHLHREGATATVAPLPNRKNPSTMPDEPQDDYDNYINKVANSLPKPQATQHQPFEDLEPYEPPNSFEPTPWIDIWETAHTDWLIEDILPQGKQTHLFGPSGVGKSLLALHLALAVIEGSPALSVYPAKPRNVMYLDYENGPGTTKERLEAYGHGFDSYNWWKDKFYMYCYPTIAPLTNTEALLDLNKAVDEHEPGLLIIDSMGLAMGGEENSADTFQQFGRGIGQMLRQKNVTCLILDNTGKDPGKGSRGSSRKKDEADVQWLLEETAPDTYQLTNKKDRIGGCPRAIAFTKHTEPELQWKRTTPKAISHQAAIIVKKLQAKDEPIRSQAHARKLGITGEQRYIVEAVR